MRRPTSVLPSLLASVLVACGGRADPSEAEPAPRAETGPVVAFLGDSLTSGYGLPEHDALPSRTRAALAAAGRPCRVINAGVTGDTSAGGLARLRFVYAQRIDVLVVALGANDAIRGVPLRDTEVSLRTIVERALGEGSRVLLVGVALPPSFPSRTRADFASMYASIARDLHVPLVPDLLAGVTGEPGMRLPDGVHPNARGTVRMAETVAEALAPLLDR